MENLISEAFDEAVRHCWWCREDRDDLHGEIYRSCKHAESQGDCTLNKCPILKAKEKQIEEASIKLLADIIASTGGSTLCAADKS